MLDGLEGFAPPDQSFWLICVFLYIVDHLRLHPGREMILAETLGRRWIPLMPLHRYRLAGLAITLLHPFFPFLAAVKLGWLEREPFSPARLQRMDALMQSHQRSLAPFRVLGCVNFVSLFIVGPAATSHAGLTYAFVLVGPIHLAAVAILAVCLAVRRRALRIQWVQVAELTFECAVCPGFFVNVCRKVSLARARLRGDAVAFSLSLGDPGALGTIAYGLESVLEDLADNGELRSDDELALSAYRVWLLEREADA